MTAAIVYYGCDSGSIDISGIDTETPESFVYITYSNMIFQFHIVGFQNYSTAWFIRIADNSDIVRLTDFRIHNYSRLHLIAIRLIAISALLQFSLQNGFFTTMRAPDI